MPVRQRAVQPAGETSPDPRSARLSHAPGRDAHVSPETEPVTLILRSDLVRRLIAMSPAGHPGEVLAHALELYMEMEGKARDGFTRLQLRNPATGDVSERQSDFRLGRD